MHYNPLLAIDFYKADHRRQYPKGTTEIYSNFTPRYIKGKEKFLHDFDNHIVVFGIQYFIQDYLVNRWEWEFFSRDKGTVVKEYKRLICNALLLDDFDVSHIEALHDLGYLPIRIKAIEEGFRVPIGVPILTIVNTHPDFYWLTNYLETIISATLWKPITTATIAFEYKRLLTKYAKITGANESFIPFQAHDFSFRGMSGWQDATISGAAHLTSFYGTDCVTVIDLLNQHYDTKNILIVGSSVPATEHSVMCCDGQEGELETVRRLITEVYPDGIVSIVADSYNLWNFLIHHLGVLHKDIMAREGKVVIRPDSGNPIEIICGNPLAIHGSPEYKGVLQLLWEEFGGITNSKGYKVLDSHIGLIYGDAITLKTAEIILTVMELQGFASSNIVFGVGSFTYQYVTRDTFGFAMKATSAVIDGKRVAIQKDPITGSGKKSAKGLLKVEVNMDSGLFELHEDVTESQEAEGALETVFENGQLIKKTDLKTIRDMLNLELEHAEISLCA